jgi:NitT/TauT family transport system ATP-binding protein
VGHHQVAAALQPRIAVAGLGLRYGDVTATRDLTFDVRPGEFVSLIGPSGCGKSSALRAIGGLLRPSSGDVRVDGSIVTGPLPAKVTFVFQDLALLPWRSARRNVEVPLEVRRVPRAQRRQRADELLSLVGLADMADPPDMLAVPLESRHVRSRSASRRACVR